METLNGVEIKRQDLKSEGGKYLFFKQLEDIAMKEGQEIKTPLNDQLFSQYDSLVITQDDEIVGRKGEDNKTINKIKGAFAAAQTLFSE